MGPRIITRSKPTTATRLRTIAAAALALTAASGAGIALANTHSATVNATPAGLSTELRGLVRMRGGPPGAIVIVQRGRRTAVFPAGVRKLGSGQAVGPGDYMRLASVSKAFSGAVALALVDHHVMSLDDTIAQWLPDQPAAWGKVTLGQALHHTSGLPDFSSNKPYGEYVGTHLHARPSPRFLLRFVAKDKLGFRPGSKFRYSNTDNIIVALMAEAATHRTYNQLLAKYVYSPLRLRQTSLPAGAGIPSPVMRGYDLVPGRPPEDDTSVFSAAYTWASGGIVSTPRELNRFARGYVGARLFSRQAQSAQFRFVSGQSDPVGPGTNAAGLAIFRYRTRCGTVYGHTGNTLGYTQFFGASRDGSRSVTASFSAQITQVSKGAKAAAFRRLRSIEVDAICVALG
jgi:D-alanyl-D-alanine carboxypeptidase